MSEHTSRTTEDTMNATDTQLIEAMKNTPAFTFVGTGAGDLAAAFDQFEADAENADAADAEGNLLAAIMFGTYVPDEDAVRRADELAAAEAAPTAGTIVDGWMHIDCGRCSGQGRIAAFARINGGQCFDCNGSGLTLVRA